MKRKEVLFVVLLLFVVPAALYFMSNTTRYESHEMICSTTSETLSETFKVNYETLSTGKVVILEKNQMQRSVVLTNVAANSFSFSDETKTYKINSKTLDALVIDDGVNTFFECTHDVFKM